MKFDVLFHDQPRNPSAPTVSFEGSELLNLKFSKPCWNCGNSTHWVDINFEAYLCSEECFREKWSEYQEALNQWRNK